MKIKKTILAFISPIIILLAWFYTTNYGGTPAAILPHISTVGTTFKAMLNSGQLQQDLVTSLSCVLQGFLISVLFGVGLGTLMGMFTTLRTILQPTVTCIRQIPMIAWMPLVILWCGVGNMSKVVLIVIASFFPILVNTQSGMELTPKSYVEVAKLYRLNKFDVFFRVYLPHALPNILVGLKLGLSVAWMAVVGAELISSTEGIGYRMSNARSLMQSDVLILCMLVVGLIGILMDQIIGRIFKALTPWERLSK